MKENIFRIRERGVNELSATFLLAAFVLLFSACKKKETLIGKNLYPIDALLQSGGIDTFKLVTYTVEHDSLNGTRSSSIAIGMMNDPKMGKLSAGLYSQYELAYLNPNIGAGVNIEVDSFVLSMKFNGANGVVSKQKVEIFEINEKMYYDTNYISTRDLVVKPHNWVTDNWVKFDNLSMQKVGADSLQPQIRVHLDVNKGMDILTHIKNTPGVFATNDAFKEYLKGLHINVTAVENDGVGMIGNFVPVSKESKMTIYFKKDGVSDVLDMLISSATTFYTRYHHVVNGTEMAALLADPSKGKQQFFAQAGKYRAAVNMSTIKNLPKKAVVHNAYLYLPVESNPLSSFKPSKTIYAISNGTKQFVANSSSGYDNYLKGYMMDLKAYVQGILTGAVTEETLLISPDGFMNSGNRLVFNGPETGNKFRPRLIITYTEF